MESPLPDRQPSDSAPAAEAEVPAVAEVVRVRAAHAILINEDCDETEGDSGQKEADPLLCDPDAEAQGCCGGEARPLVRIGVPAALQALFDSAGFIVSSAIVGHLCGVDALAGSAASAAFQILSLSFAFSLPNCLNTLCSQAYGAENYKLCGNWLQIGLAVFTVAAAPIFVIWYFLAERAVRLMGAEPNVASLAHIYARYSILGWYADGLMMCVTQYYESFGVIKQSMWITIGFIPVNVALNYILIDGIGSWGGWGYKGSPIALSICRCLQLSTFVSWCAFRGHHKKTWPGWTLDSFQTSRVIEFIRQGVPQAIGAVAEQGQFQLLTIFAVHLGTTQLAAWSALGEVWGMLIAAAFGICKAVNVRVSTHLGAGHIPKAKEAARIGLIICGGAGTVCAVVMYLIREPIGRLYTSDQKLIDKIASLCWLQATSLFLFSPGIVAFFILDGQGRPELGALGAGLGAWVFNVPLAAVAVYVLHWGVEGIYAAMIVGYTVIIIFLWTIVYRSPWQRLVQDAKRRSEVADDTPAEGTVPAPGGAEAANAPPPAADAENAPPPAPAVAAVASVAQAP
eukprot:TRINITY_DN10397_c0_g2_i1.p1 TRINITY_DN10397_c0_g2~~TRINITY_DN10397_c0_g2_i1.p1  ORF type:complete len:595 (+),score=191.10 TRINITY_DN10397_c0_g2_i1:79-1785(+)